jgi:hypothetical protein
MIRILLSVVMVVVLLGPFASGHAFGHAGVEADGHASHSHSSSAHQKCERSCDDEKSRPCCHDAVVHCVTFGVGMSSDDVVFRVGMTKAWSSQANSVFGGLFSEAATPPPRI